MQYRGPYARQSIDAFAMVGMRGSDMRLSKWGRGAAALALFAGIGVGAPLTGHASGGSGCTVGQWTVMSTPALPQQYQLWATLALSPTDVWAAGGSNSIGGPNELFEHWDGTSWIQIPGAGIPGGDITALAGASESDVWAFGSFSAGGPGGLVEHWDGAGWRLAVDGVPGGTVVSAVALGTADVWAYGRVEGQGYVEHWNGHTWTVMPNVGTGWGQIAASSDFNVWITGFGQTGHWNGAAWTFTPVVEPSDNTAVMTGVAVSPTGGPWTAGGKGLGAGVPDLQTWNGGGWSETTVGGLSSDAGRFSSMSAASSTDVWAIGEQSGPTAAHWDGTQWTSVPPLTLGPDDRLNAVSALPGQAWVAGTTFNSTLGDQPLIETYCS